MDRTLSRRTLLRGVVGGAALIPLVQLSSLPARADQPEIVPEDDPQAQALEYVKDADAADIERPERAGVPGEEQYCYNCALYLENGDDDWGPCAILANRLVAARGWCNAWVPRA